MAIPLRKDEMFNPPADLGPYRRKDYEALPDEPRYELIYGRFYLSPAPSPLHQMVSFLLAKKLEQIAWDARAWVYVAPLDVSLFDHSIVQPDILYISAARRRLIGDDRIEGAPDLVVEVLSPGTARRDRKEKLQLYAESGVREYWMFDLPRREVEFLLNEGGRFVEALPKDGIYRSRALSEVSLDIPGFWREVDERLARLEEDEA